MKRSSLISKKFLRNAAIVLVIAVVAYVVMYGMKEGFQIREDIKASTFKSNDYVYGNVNKSGMVYLIKNEDIPATATKIRMEVWSDYIINSNLKPAPSTKTWVPTKTVAGKLPAMGIPPKLGKQITIKYGDPGISTSKLLAYDKNSDSFVLPPNPRNNYLYVSGLETGTMGGKGYNDSYSTIVDEQRTNIRFIFF